MTTEQQAQAATVPGGDNLLGASSPPQLPATNVGLPPPAYLQELRVAAERDEASFSQMFIADLLARDPLYGPELGSEAKALIPRLLRAFENRYGNIIDSRYGYMCPAGAVLLERLDPPKPEPPTPTGSASHVKRWSASRSFGGSSCTSIARTPPSS